MLKRMLARLFGLSSGKRPPLPAASSPSELCFQVEGVLSKGMTWTSALGLCPDRPAECRGTREPFDMESGTLAAGQADCCAEAHAGDAPPLCLGRRPRFEHKRLLRWGGSGLLHGMD